MFDYILAYLVYFFGASAVIFGFWMMFSSAKAKYLRDVSIIFIAVLILTPIDAYVGEEYLELMKTYDKNSKEGEGFPLKTYGNNCELPRVMPNEYVDTPPPA